MTKKQPARSKARGNGQQKSVLKQIDELNRMSMDQLRKRWNDLLGTEPGRMGHWPQSRRRE
ncbi:MAG TPA: hypothetical protein QF564_12645 [Pirellulaceae bacterium]|jgi:hypothetical protein|nr:hypothetical protein [Pirellulaceae bacterium]